MRSDVSPAPTAKPRTPNEAAIASARLSSHVRRGRKIKLKLELRRTQTGVRFTRTIRFRIPPDTSPGERTIRLSGTDAEPGSNPNDDGDLSIVFEDGPPEGPAPESVDEIRSALKGLERYVGITATVGGVDIEAYRDPDLRISGDARVTVTVRR